LGCFIRSAKEKNALTSLSDFSGDMTEIESQFSPPELEMINGMKTDRQLYHKIISSVAPHIFGTLYLIFLK
jgi:DNA replicative helicase MCM subunit Mcm2 (Cdc46/Mcm family)